MKDFKLTISSLGWFISELTKMITSKQNKAYRVCVVEWREKRSLSQNALYHKWLDEISKQARVNGKLFSVDVWHEYFKKYYCKPTVIDMPAGEPVTIITTTKLDVGEMHHYLNKIERWAQDKAFTLTIPLNCEYRELLERQDD